MKTFWQQFSNFVPSNPFLYLALRMNVSQKPNMKTTTFFSLSYTTSLLVLGISMVLHCPLRGM